MRKSHIFIFYTLLLFACTKTDGGGYVQFNIDDDISAPLAVEVKSASETEVTAAQIDAFSLWVDGTRINGTYGSVKNETYKLRTGTYRAHVQNCTSDEAESEPDIYGSVRYYGSTDFEVRALETTQNVTINCSIANARVAVILAEDFTDYFIAENTDVSISDSQDFSSRILPMIADGVQVAAQGIRNAYFTAGDPVYAEVTTRKKGADRDVTYKVRAIAAAQSNTSYTITLSVDENSTSGGISFIVGSNEMSTNDFLSIESYTPITGGYVWDNDSKL